MSESAPSEEVRKHAPVTLDHLLWAARALAILNPEAKDAFEYDCDGVGRQKLAQLLSSALRAERERVLEKARATYLGTADCSPKFLEYLNKLLAQKGTST